MRRRIAVAGAVLAITTGCAGIPTSGSVHFGKSLSSSDDANDVSLRFLPPPARAGLPPTAVVQGFLRAMVNNDGHYEIARTYLTDHASTTWNVDAGVTTYDDTSVQVVQTGAQEGTRTVQLRVPRVGFIDPRGEYTPEAGHLRTTFPLVRQRGQWRIAQPPRGLLLSTSDTQRAFRLVTLYYIDRTHQHLVPEQLLIRPQSSGLTTALVRALLAGPGPWIAPAVSTAFPRGTELLGNVPVGQDGVAEVNLTTAARQASPVQLRAFSAQLIWTLRQVSGVSSMRLLADGAAIAVPGTPIVQPRDSWQSMDPAPDVAAPAFYSAGRSWRSVSGSTDPDLRNAAGLDSLALSADGRMLAGLRIGRRAELMVWHSGSRPVPRIVADTLTAPTFDPAGDAFTVATAHGRRWLSEVTPGGDVRHVTASPTLLARPIQLMRLSRDGSRVAAIAGAPGHGQLLVGRVSQRADGLHVDGFRNVLPAATDVRGVAWEGATQLDVTIGIARRQREVVTVDVDGYAVRPVATDGVHGAPIDVAAAPGSEILVEADGSVWQAAGTARWRRVGAGTQPGYPG